MTQAQEYEIRLFSQQGDLILIVPVVATDSFAIQRSAEALARDHEAASYRLLPQLSTARHERRYSR